MADLVETKLTYFRNIQKIEIGKLKEKNKQKTIFQTTLMKQLTPWRLFVERRKGDIEK